MSGIKVQNTTSSYTARAPHALRRKPWSIRHRFGSTDQPLPQMTTEHGARR
jgi:hypothetical protein